jgi:hypothetical protein
VASAAAESVKSDDEIVNRAVQAWLPQALREQRNRESVLEELVEEIRAGALIDASAEAEVVSDDWIERYAEFAGKISESDLKVVLARLLVCEIRSPGDVPVSTLRTVSELDQQSIKLFQKLSERVMGGQWLVFSKDLYKDPAHQELLDLCDAGLILFPDMNVGSDIQLASDRPARVEFGDYFLELVGKSTDHAFISAVPLTRAGRQVYKILAKPNAEANGQRIVDMLLSYIKNAELYRKTPNGVVHVKTLVRTVESDEQA